MRRKSRILSGNYIPSDGGEGSLLNLDRSYIEKIKGVIAKLSGIQIEQVDKWIISNHHRMEDIINEMLISERSDKIMNSTLKNWIPTIMERKNYRELSLSQRIDLKESYILGLVPIYMATILYHRNR